MLDFRKGSEFTEVIINEIDLLKGSIKTFRKLTNVINNKFNTSFSIPQIQYQSNKLLKLTFGSPQEDAYLFVELAKTEAENGGFFQYKTNSSSQFSSALFLSKTMLQYSKHFLDIIIVDATYRRNRFNLPLINIMGINNYGKNIMLAFGLLTNETIESYIWLFAELKKAWNGQKPMNFIIDGCSAMKQGKLIFIKPNFL